MDQFTSSSLTTTKLRYWAVPLLHQNLRGATLSGKDIPTSPYTKGENNNNNNHIGESNNNHIGENNNHFGENNNNKLNNKPLF